MRTDVWIAFGGAGSGARSGRIGAVAPSIRPVGASARRASGALLFAWIAWIAIAVPHVAPAQTFYITERKLDIPVNDVVYDPASGLLYASVGSQAASNLANTIAIIDPVAGSVVGSIPVKSDPNPIGISDDGTTLWVGIDGSGELQRVNLLTRTPGPAYNVGAGSFTGQAYAEDVEVLRGQPNVAVVSRRNAGFSPRHEGVAVYDNGVMRPTITQNHTGSNRIELTDQPNVLIGYNNETTEFGTRRISIGATGATQTVTVSNLISGFGTDITYVDGLVYATTGKILDPTGPSLVGSVNASGSITADPSRDLVFVASSGFSSSNPQLSIFDRTRRTLLQATALKTPGSGSGRLVRWGSDGLAIRLSDGFFSTTSSLLLLNVSTTPPPDRDGDGVPDIADNCVDDVNPNQSDQDGDRVGDVCDPLPTDPTPASTIDLRQDVPYELFAIAPSTVTNGQRIVLPPVPGASIAGRSTSFDVEIRLPSGRFATPPPGAGSAAVAGSAAPGWNVEQLSGSTGECVVRYRLSPGASAVPIGNGSIFEIAVHALQINQLSAAMSQPGRELALDVLVEDSASGTNLFAYRVKLLRTVQGLVIDAPSFAVRPILTPTGGLYRSAPFTIRTQGHCSGFPDGGLLGGSRNCSPDDEFVFDTLNDRITLSLQYATYGPILETSADRIWLDRGASCESAGLVASRSGPVSQGETIEFTLPLPAGSEELELAVCVETANLSARTVLRSTLLVELSSIFLRVPAPNVHSIELEMRCYGDLNGDRRVDNLDAVVFDACYPCPSGPWCSLECDANTDSTVNGVDALSFSQSFGGSCMPTQYPPYVAMSTIQAVPEPGPLALGVSVVAVAAAGRLRRRGGESGDGPRGGGRTPAPHERRRSALAARLRVLLPGLALCAGLLAIGRPATATTICDGCAAIGIDPHYGAQSFEVGSLISVDIFMRDVPTGRDGRGLFGMGFQLSFDGTALGLVDSRFDALWMSTGFTDEVRSQDSLGMTASRAFQRRGPSGVRVPLASVTFQVLREGVHSMVFDPLTGPGDNLLFDGTLLDRSPDFFAATASIDTSIAPIPEPGVGLLLGLGLAGLGARRRAGASLGRSGRPRA